jgi:hypothetical protein
MTLLRMCLVSVMGMLEDMLEKSRQANVWEVRIGVSFKLWIKCEEFLMLKGHGRADSLFIMCVRAVANL